MLSTGIRLILIMTALAVMSASSLNAPTAASETFAAASGGTFQQQRHLQATCTDFCAGKNPGLYANPCDSTCSTFINCANGITYIQSCSPGTLFNSIINTCDWPSSFQCGGGGSPASQPPTVAKNPPPPSPSNLIKPPPPSPSNVKKPPLPSPANTMKPPSPSPTSSFKPPPPNPNGSLVFSPYKDITINMDWNTNVISTMITGSRQSVISIMPSNLRVLTWAFATGDCGSENWAGVTPASLIAANVNAFVNAGKQYIISTGGAAGAFRCSTGTAFINFLKKYNSNALIGVDFDIEANQPQSDIADLVQGVKAARAGGFGHLRYSFTIATLGGATGNQLNTLGTSVLNALKNAQMGWNSIYINLMVMDYGGACTVFTNGVCNMGQSAINAAKALNSYWGVPYSSIELTPMIGGNDSPGQTFTLADVTTVSSFVKQYGIGGVHFWSLDRDVDCSPGAASATCNSYGKAGTLGFTKAFLSNLGL